MDEIPKDVWILVSDEPDDDIGSRAGDDVGGGFGSRVARAAVRRVSVNVDELQRSMGDLLTVLRHVFEQAQQQSGLRLESVELAVDISAEGEVSILAAGGKIAGRGALKLSFKRDNPGN